MERNDAINPGAFDELLEEHKLYGVVAEFARPEDLLRAARQVRQQGYSHLDVYSPFPIHGIDAAIGDRRSRLGWIVFPIGLCGTLFGFLLQWWTGAVNYKLVIAGKPFFAFEPSIPVMFECTILFSAFAAVLGMLALNGLPRFYHPVFKYHEYHKVTDDGFLLVVEAGDPNFDVPQVQRDLQAAGAVKTEVVEA